MGVGSAGSVGVSLVGGSVQLAGPDCASTDITGALEEDAERRGYPLTAEPSGCPPTAERDGCPLAAGEPPGARGSLIDRDGQRDAEPR